MSRRMSAVVEVPEWESVTREQPCPICGAPAGCEVLAEEQVFVRCLATASEWPVLGGGWLHRLAGREQRS